MLKITELVNEYAARTGTTRQELADRLGMSRVSLYMRLKGSIEFSLSQAVKLAEILGCDLTDLVSL